VTKRTLVVVVLAAIVLATVGFGILAWQRQAQRESILDSGLPPAPDLADWPATFRQRVDAAIARTKQGPDRIAALGELSRLYHANGFLVEASACYTALEALQPDEPRWRHRHASILAGFGDTDAAQTRWERVVQLAPDYVPARLRLADVLLKDNRRDAAAVAYSAVLNRDPTNPYAELGLARCDFEAERWEAARRRLESLVAQTNYRLGYDLIVTVYERLGDDARATAVRAKERASGAYRDPPDPWLDELVDDCYDAFRLSLVAGFLASSGDANGAIRRLEHAIACSPDNHVLHFQLAGVYLSMRSYSKAREQFERCTQLAPDFPDGWAQLADLCTTLGDRPAAERALAAGLKNCPTSPGLHLMAAQTLQRTGRTDEAIAEYRESIRLRPNEAGAFVDLARYLINLNRVDEARAELRAALVAEPDHPAALAILAYEAISHGDEAAARQWLDQARHQPRVPADQMNTLLGAFAQKFGHQFQ